MTFSLQILAGIIWSRIAPLFHELFELIIDAVGHHDTHGREKVAGARLCLEAFASQTKGAP
jgi:hypothetical protein